VTSTQPYFTCPRCGVLWQGAHTCRDPQPIVTLPTAESAGAVLTGWMCPACGRGNAPWASFCPCTSTPTPRGEQAK